MAIYEIWTKDDGSAEIKRPERNFDSLESAFKHIRGNEVQRLKRLMKQDFERAQKIAALLEQMDGDDVEVECPNCGKAYALEPPHYLCPECR